MFLDIHSHILPNVDDGAKDINEALQLLEKMKNQGITHVLATPHFYPFEDNLEDFLKKTQLAFKLLKDEIKDKDLPEIFLGSEMLYYEGIGESMSVYELCLSNTNYLLLEFLETNIPDRAFKDMVSLIEKHGIIPIIAHIERYYKARNFSKLISFVKKRNIPVEINADSFKDSELSKTIKLLFNKKVVTFIATDSHSVDHRPPKLLEAFEYITKNFGEKTTTKLKMNSIKMLDQISFEDFHI